MISSRKNLSALLVAAAAATLPGCVQTNMTNPPRSATEQLLLSTSVDRAMQSPELINFAGKKVFVDTTYFDSYDSKNAIGTIRDAVNSSGAFLVSNAAGADYVIEARAGALSIDYTSDLIGMPNSGLPIPLAGTLAIPEIALYKTESQYALAKISLLAYSRTNGEHFYSSGPLIGKSYNKYFKLLGIITWTRTDLPEKKRQKHEKADKQPPTK